MFNRVSILFLVLMFAVSGYLGYTVDVQRQASKLNRIYSNALTTALDDAAGQMSYSETTQTAMGTEEIRNNIINTFFNTLSITFGYNLITTDEENNELAYELTHDRKNSDTYVWSASDVERQGLYRHIPLILLVDNDGFYVWYSETTTDINIEHGRISSKYTWSEESTIGRSSSSTYNCFIRYYLGNKVSIRVKTTDSSVTFTGTIEDVFNELIDNFGEEHIKDSSLKRLFFEDQGYNESYDESKLYTYYAERRNHIVAESVEEYVQYYINNKNMMNSIDSESISEAYSSDRTYYLNDTNITFEMPELSDEDWMDMLQNPTVISFLQGLKVQDLQKTINIYSFSGSEYGKDAMYGTDDTNKLYYEYEQ